MGLKTLRATWDRLATGRRRQKKLRAKTGKRGYAKRAALLGKRMRAVKAQINRLSSVAPGPPAWGGGKQIIREEVWPIVQAAGITPTSGKRRETFGNPGSDHFIGNAYAFAKDYATGSNFRLAQKIRTKLDGGLHVDYQSFNIVRRGHTYRVQIIAGTHGTGPHLHVGIRRVS